MKINYNLAVVTKANALIEACYKLSANEQKLILLLTSSIKRTDTDFQRYQVSVKSLAKAFGLKNTDIYNEVRAIVLGLQRKTLSIRQEDAFLDINWLSSAKYIFTKGIVELSFDSQLKPYLLNLKKRFTSYKFKDIAQLKSSFSIRIFELLKEFENIKSRVIPLVELRAMLKIKPTQYQTYFNFKNRVLLTAQKELTKKSSLTFEFEAIKECRKVIAIRFIIKEQTAIQVAQLDSTSIKDIETIDA